MRTAEPPPRAPRLALLKARPAASSTFVRSSADRSVAIPCSRHGVERETTLERATIVSELRDEPAGNARAAALVDVRELLDDFGR
jgi:hypothetical protein